MDGWSVHGHQGGDSVKFICMKKKCKLPQKSGEMGLALCMTAERVLATQASPWSKVGCRILPSCVMLFWNAYVCEQKGFRMFLEQPSHCRCVVGLKIHSSSSRSLCIRNT